MAKILCFGEPLIRISPNDFGQVHDETRATLFYGGSEVNICRNLQGFGAQTKLLTALPNSQIGDRFLTFLNQAHIDTTHIVRIGHRVGIYFLEIGVGERQSQVFYDRQYTSLSELRAEHLDLDSVFDDVSHFHFSGVTVAVSESVRELLDVLLPTAKARGITITFDLNLRTRMISIPDAKREFSRFAKYADYCFGIEPLMLDETDTAMFDRVNATRETIAARMHALREHFGLKAIFHTVRSTDPYGRNVYQAYAYDGQLYESVQLKTQVLQRVGSGDALISGVLYQLQRGCTLQEVIDFGVASGTWKCTLAGDSMSATVETVEQLLKEQYDIVR